MEPDLERTAAVRAWFFAMGLSATVQAFARAPVEERRPECQGLIAITAVALRR